MERLIWGFCIVQKRKQESCSLIMKHPTDAGIGWSKNYILRNRKQKG